MLNLLGIYLIGKSLHIIKVDGPAREVADHLQRIASRVRENDINTDLFNRIFNFAQGLRPRGTEVLDYNQREALKKKIDVWSSLIENHLGSRRILTPSKPGALDQEQLYELSKRNPSGTFQDVWWRMSDIERSDLMEASRCLLTQSWTAAAMISLRALESILRKYYEIKSNKKHEKRGMHALIEELQRMENIRDTLMGYLNYLRGIRNMAEHPDRAFDQTEAESVFMQVAAAVREMYQEIPG